MDDAWWALIKGCFKRDPKQRPSFEWICMWITEEPERFAMAKDAKSQAEFRKYVEDFNEELKDAVLPTCLMTQKQKM